MPEGNKVRPCPALDALVAEKALQWEFDGDRWYPPDSPSPMDLPRWSSDPGEALALLEQERQHHRYYVLHSSPQSWRSRRNCEPNLRERPYYPLALAIVIGVLAACGVPKSKIKEASQ